MDKSLPAAPSELFSQAGWPNSNVLDLWSEVLHEMTAETYFGRAHHSTGTYDKGCRGPLCRKANREHPRRHSGLRYSPREERSLDPVLEYFHVVLKYRIMSAQLAQRE